MTAPNTQRTLETAMGLHRAGKIDQAQALYQQILAREPNHADALHLSGVAVMHGGGHQAAAELIRRAIAIKPSIADFHFNLGLALAGAGKSEEAIAAFRQAIKLNPGHGSAFLKLAAELCMRQRWEEAMPACQKAVQLLPRNADAHNVMGGTLYGLGRFEESAAAFGRAIALGPQSAQAHCNLGSALRALRRYDESVGAYRQALTLQPNFPEGWSNLGIVLYEARRMDASIEACRRALALRPQAIEAQNTLGNALMDKGQVDDAIAAFRAAIAINPNHPHAHNHLGNALSAKHEMDEAIRSIHRALELRPEFPEALNNLGNALRRVGKVEQGIEAFRRALALRPDYIQVHNNLGIALNEKGWPEEALGHFQRAVELQPQYVEAHTNLGNIYKILGRPDESVASHARALALRPDDVNVLNNLGNAYKDMGQMRQAMECYEKAMAISPRDAVTDSNRVYAMLFDPASDSQSILRELKVWDERHGKPLAPLIQPHLNNRESGRRLKVGYVSPDFREHVIGRNLLPLFREHDRDQVEIHLYSTTSAVDDMTPQFQALASGWRDIWRMPEERCAQIIREDGIDILVDLTLHLGDNRLLTFARKPAPVQVTFAGYPGGTGLSAIDWRLTDPYLDPPGQTEGDYVERSYRLAHSFWCYDPKAMEWDRSGGEAPRPNELPAMKNGFVTFGCLNNFCKINDVVLDLWGRVLAAVPRSRLMLMAPAGSSRRWMAERLSRWGIEESRIEFVPYRPRRQYLAGFGEMDLGLDTYPYNGHTTSLDSLWMGVPVVTRIGNTIVGRAGWSQLSNLGLTELAAKDDEQFIRIAAELAGDLPRLVELRRTLRQRMMDSPLTDARGFAGSIEGAFRDMWTQWCSGT